MNELNVQMKKIITGYAEKNGLQIVDEFFGKFFFIASLPDGRKLICNTITGTRTDRGEGQIYMKMKDSGRQKRIPKKQW